MKQADLEELIATLAAWVVNDIADAYDTVELEAHCREEIRAILRDFVCVEDDDET